MSSFLFCQKYHSPCWSVLDFWKINFEKFKELDFYSISNWIITAGVACKNQFRKWFLQPKNPVWVFQLDFLKFKYRSTGGLIDKKWVFLWFSKYLHAYSPSLTYNPYLYDCFLRQPLPKNTTTVGGQFSMGCPVVPQTKVNSMRCIFTRYSPVCWLGVALVKPTICDIVRWFAGPMGQTTRRPSVWCSKYFFFHNSL